MTAKEYLSQAYWLDKLINSKLRMVTALREMTTRTTGVVVEDVVSRTRDVHGTQEMIAKIVDLENEINADIDQLVDLKRDIMLAVKSVHEPELQVLLELRYLCFMDWSEIASELHCSESNVYKIHSRALKAIRIPKLDSELQSFPVDSGVSGVV